MKISFWAPILHIVYLSRLIKHLYSFSEFTILEIAGEVKFIRPFSAEITVPEFEVHNISTLFRCVITARTDGNLRELCTGTGSS